MFTKKAARNLTAGMCIFTLVPNVSSIICTDYSEIGGDDLHMRCGSHYSHTQYQSSMTFNEYMYIEFGGNLCTRFGSRNIRGQKKKGYSHVMMFLNFVCCGV